MASFLFVFYRTTMIRFKKMDQIPFDLIGELMSKFTTQQWIDLYENLYVKK